MPAEKISKAQATILDHMATGARLHDGDPCYLTTQGGGYICDVRKPTERALLRNGLVHTGDRTYELITDAGHAALKRYALAQRIKDRQTQFAFKVRLDAPE